MTGCVVSISCEPSKIWLALNAHRTGRVQWNAGIAERSVEAGVARFAATLLDVLKRRPERCKSYVPSEYGFRPPGKIGISRTRRESATSRDFEEQNLKVAGSQACSLRPVF